MLLEELGIQKSLIKFKDYQDISFMVNIISYKDLVNKNKMISKNPLKNYPDSTLILDSEPSILTQQRKLSNPLDLSLEGKDNTVDNILRRNNHNSINNNSGVVDEDI